MSKKAEETAHLLTVCERCEKGTKQPPHSCPFKAEINNDELSQCTCCKECMHECAMDV